MNRAFRYAVGAALLFAAAIFSNQFARSQGFICCFKPPTCAAADAYLARTTEGAVTAGRLRTMICGMVANGVGCSAWSGSSGNMDVFYVHAQDNQTDALLNLCSTSFTNAITGGVTFTADSNFTSNNTTGFLAANFIPSTAGGNFTTNLAHMGSYVLASASTNPILMGCSFGTTSTSYLIPTSSGAAFNALNASTNISPVGIGVPGLWIISKTSSTVQTLYRNGNTTPIGTANPTTNNNCSNQLYILARNANGTVNFGTDAAPVAAAFAGGALNATQQNTISFWLNGFMASQGINVY